MRVQYGVRFLQIVSEDMPVQRGRRHVCDQFHVRTRLSVPRKQGPPRRKMYRTRGLPVQGFQRCCSRGTMLLSCYLKINAVFTLLL